MIKGIKVKTPQEIKIMAEGGRILAQVKNELLKAVKIGVDALSIDKLAEKLILEKGAQCSFKMVPGYSWTTCVNINDGIVHGIPKKEIIFKSGDLVSIDVGVFFNGFHTDTSFSVGLDVTSQINIFLESGKKALDRAIMEAKVGNRVYDISRVIETEITTAGYTPVRALVGHGVGRDLHEEPQIPCFTTGNRNDSPLICEGYVIAIEVMYTMGGSNLVLEKDGWTISTSDGTISGLFEDTVAVTREGPKILTR